VCRVAAGVNQCAERHVAADTRKTVEIGEFHGMPPRELPVRSSPVGEELIVSAEAKSVKRGVRLRAADRPRRLSRNEPRPVKLIAMKFAESGGLVNNNTPPNPLFFVSVHSRRFKVL
jgi:hypothetical protein